MTQEKGILSDPNPKKGARIGESILKDVIAFYKSESVSRIMPGKKDSVSVIRNGVKVKEQMHLILSNLKEAYKLFKETHPEHKIGFSKFAELRPKECVLVGSSDLPLPYPPLHDSCRCNYF